MRECIRASLVMCVCVSINVCIYMYHRMNVQERICVANGHNLVSNKLDQYH